MIQGNVPTSETSSEHLVTLVPTRRIWATIFCSGIVREDALLISSFTPDSGDITGDVVLSPDGWVAADLLANRVEGTALSLT